MGKRGPAPTPTRVLQIRGTHRRDRHGDPADEPQFELLTELPPPPGFFDAMAKMEWNRIGPQLVEQQLLTKVDLAAFGSYCLNVSRMVAAERELALHGMMIVTPQGFLQAHPCVSIARQCGAEVRKFSQEFGLTPSARTRVRPPESKKKPKDDPWSDVG